MEQESDNVQFFSQNSADEDDNAEQVPLLRSEMEFSSLTIDEMENRLEVDQPMEDEHVAYALYCIYARAKGFSVRKHTELKFPDGSGVKARDFVCSAEGHKDEKRSKNNVPTIIKPTFRCQCKAKLRVARLKGQNWRITAFRKEHTHDMYSPEESHLLRSARHVSPEMKRCFESMVKCGIPVARAFEFMKTLSHGRENVGCTQKDVYDELQRSRKMIENGDATKLIEYFARKTNNEPYFYWNVEKDENDRLINFFFRDFRCSVDYEYFGDVLSFDTTYRTNKYNMIACPFVGINHHLQTVMFGFAFLSNERQSSFEWLFRVFLDSMGGKQPESIFTDQCQAMMNAIATVFTESHHRLCHWHINQNAPSHFGNLNDDWSFKTLWYKSMDRCYSEEEFEHTWKQMVDNFGIEEIQWFRIMYGLRHKWSTAFSRHKFSAGLLATSRSEGANAALKKKIGGAKSSLHDCVLAYEKVQESWRMDEGEKDCRTHHGRLPVGKNPWLIQAANVYTMEIFILFQQEVRDLIDFSITEHRNVPNTSLVCFTVTPRDGTSRSFGVQLDTTTLNVSCGCHKFDTFGILCSHVLKVFDRFDLNYIPEIYIKRRWTKTVTNRISDGRRTNKSTGAFDMIFINEMVKKCYAASNRANRSKEAKLVLAEGFDFAIEKMNALFDNVSIDEVNAEEDLDGDRILSQTSELFVRDPLNVKSKGVTDVRARHWDVSKKKTKGKGESSKRDARGKKRQVQSSQRVEEECLSQETNEGAFCHPAATSQHTDALAYFPQTTSFTALLHQTAFHR